MKRQPIEIYGFGTRLPTRNDRATRVARVVIGAAVIVFLVVLGAPQ